MDPVDRWDDWEWEKAAQEMGRRYRLDDNDRYGKQENKYYFSGDSGKRFRDKWTGSQIRVVLSGLLFLTMVFSSKGQDFFSQKVYAFYRGGIESGNVYTALNSMAREAIGITETNDIAVDAPASEGIFYPPVGGAVKTGFLGKNISGQISRGIEIESTLGTPVLCPKNGVVQEISGNESMGKMIRINFSDGWEGLLANLGDISVEKGDPVSIGMKIGTVGISSERQKPWLYFELRQNGEAVNPLNYLIRNE